MSNDNRICKPNPSPLASDEFARDADRWLGEGLSSDATRRAFLKRMAAGLALAGIGTAGCSDRATSEKLVPRTRSDADSTPGVAMTFATAISLSGYARGLLVTCREGRPVKIEGNPDHPSSLGGTDVFGQASILDLYDPARSQTPTYAGAPTNWSSFFSAFDDRMSALRAVRGKGLRVLSGAVTSPTLVAQIKELERTLPEARWHTFEPLDSANALAGAAMAFGRPLQAVHEFAGAKVILSLDSDFLFDAPGSLRHARQLADGRRVRTGRWEMNRLYVVEPALSITGSMADHRLCVPPDEIESFARALLGQIKTGSTQSTSGEPSARWLNAVATDLIAHAGESLVVVGESQPPVVHAIAHSINAALGNFDKTVHFIEPVAFAAADESRSLQALVDDLSADRVHALIVIGGDPAYAAPADLRFADILQTFATRRAADGSLANFSVHLGERANATSARCAWRLPQTHYLEQWSDCRGHDGTASIVQPMIAPLFGGRSAHELIERILGRLDRSDYEIVREYWKNAFGDSAFESRWQAALKTGIVNESVSPSVGLISPNLPMDDDSPPQRSADALRIVFRPDPSVWDGTFAQNAWLQELPRPFSKLVWDNAALISEATAQAHSLAEGDVVRITLDGRSIEIPVAIQPGVANNVVLLHLGYGQPGIDPESNEVIGANAYQIRTQASHGFAIGATLEKQNRRHTLVRTRSHHAMTGDSAKSPLTPHAIVNIQSAADDANRRLVRVATIDELRRNPDVIKDLGAEGEKKPLLSLYPSFDTSKGYQWGMSIDQTTCIGCNACVVACQAENNIPVVGKDQVARQREMHWLRIDDYLGGTDAEPQVTHQPVPCMHCENAPCEVVCPVAATNHSVEGLNQMVYNRCVGTRYCSNNCPYKVRRFNFLDYTRAVRESPSKQLLQNPEVTVRSRGVMEKCSYCIQRLQQTRIEVERMAVDAREQARLAPDALLSKAILDEADRREFQTIDRLETACAQACPTRAITFGSVTQVAGQQTRLMSAKAQPTDYVLLRELTTKPRTSYLARITNPNSALSGEREAT